MSVFYSCHYNLLVCLKLLIYQPLLSKDKIRSRKKQIEHISLNTFLHLYFVQHPQLPLKQRYFNNLIEMNAIKKP